MGPPPPESGADDMVQATPFGSVVIVGRIDGMIMLFVGVLDAVLGTELSGAIYAFAELAELGIQLTDVAVTVTVDLASPELGADDVLMVVGVALFPPLIHDTRLVKLLGPMVVTADNEPV
ncbi:hypothetical protein LTR86_000526 [Recurvomyces mirabilis]|nr:hypothetical protein LTR86_000526 [Recurvomyces mirabilis]